MARTARSTADRTEKAATAVPAVKKTAKKAPATTTKKAAGAKKAPATAAKKAVTAKTAKTTATKTTASKAGPAKKTAVKKTSAKTSGTDRAVSATAGTAAKPRRSTSTAARSLTVKADEKPWTTAELDEVRGELHADRERLRSELNLAEHDLHDLMRDAGDGAGNDQADVGSTTFERDHEMSLANNARDMLAQTERALARIEDATYGVCESCGEPIGKMRLMAFPRATLCLSCKQREERR
jgi:RNA polymerase-binding protein DksA